jgi:hypothetical protein
MLGASGPGRQNQNNKKKLKTLRAETIIYLS